MSESYEQKIEGLARYYDNLVPYMVEAREVARRIRAVSITDTAPVPDPAGVLQRAEERLCTCGAAGSGEGHTDWCDWSDTAPPPAISGGDGKDAALRKAVEIFDWIICMSPDKPVRNMAQSAIDQIAALTDTDRSAAPAISGGESVSNALRNLLEWVDPRALPGTVYNDAIAALAALGIADTAPTPAISGGENAVLREVRRAIVEADPAVLICTLWMPDNHPNETVVDFIDNALAAADRSASR